MILKKAISYLFLITLCFGCSHNTDYEVLADRITERTADQLKKEKGLRVIGTGGQMMGDIQLMGIEFYYYHLVDLQEARKLFVYAAQTYLNNINENKEIRPYLHNYPFTVKNIEITIFVSQRDGQHPPQGDIEVVTLRGDTIIYKLTAPSKFEPWPVLHEETYEEALKIVGENP